jgi:hypothetical protein
VKVPDSAKTSDAGTALVNLLVTTDLGWLFREQPTRDYGIDAQVEIVMNGEASGRLLALQVKSGASYLKEASAQGFVFRPDADHVTYWLYHSLPVIVVLVDVDNRQAWWQHVSRSTLVSTGKGWRLIVPREQTLSAHWIEQLAAMADADPYTLKLRQLQFNKPWMRLLDEGGDVILDIEEWVNKSSGRASLQLTAYDRHGHQVADREWPWLIFPFADYAVELPRLFPWADLDIDDATYDDWYTDETGYTSSESRSESQGTEPAERPLRPYEDTGEVARWRLILTLSELGKAFLTLDDRLLEEGLIPLA